jgi:hypothetical protein
VDRVRPAASREIGVGGPLQLVASGADILQGSSVQVSEHALGGAPDHCFGWYSKDTLRRLVHLDDDELLIERNDPVRK